MDNIIKILLLLLYSEVAISSHFRGGTLSWKPSGKGNEILITYRNSWRRSWGPNTGCTDDDIKNKVLKTGDGNLLWSVNGNSWTITAANYYCTDYSTTDDWTTGERTDYPFKTSHLVYWIGFYGQAWIDLNVGGGGYWQVWSRVNLTRRHDNGKINSSPVTTSAPIIRVQSGCYSEINILATDPDNDFIICKWADKNVEGCGSICNGLPGANINPRTCTISYNASRTGFYGVAIQIFDYASLTDPQPLSSIPLQFLLYVYKGSGKCTARIRFSQLTRLDKACVGVPLNSTYEERFYATTGSDDDEIIDFTTSSPTGMIKSSVKKVNGSAEEKFLEPLNKGSWYYVSVTWTPDHSQVGSNIFCFAAISKNQLTSKQRCITLVVGEIPPTIIKQQLKPSPTSTILPTDTTFEMVFDKPILRPLFSSFFKIYTKDYKEVYSIDGSTSFKYETAAENKIRVHADSIKFEEKQTYFITLDNGIGTSRESCGIQSTFIRNREFWNFTIKDVTAPTIRFTKSESKTNSSVYFTWIFDEPASAVCSLTTPTTYIRNVNCSVDSWSTTLDNDGYYTLWVYGTDTTGNTGLSGRHSWKVDTVPPEVVISTQNLANVSNDRTYTIYFECNNDDSCFTKCRLTQQNVTLQPFSDCSSQRYGVINGNLLKSGIQYTIEIVASDDVNNVAAPVTWSWTSDFDKPNITSVSNKTVKCGDSTQPEDLGKPQVSDLLDPHPLLTYSDADVAGCNILRTWLAKDHAGNVASMKQLIHTISVLPIKVKLPSKALIPCSNNLYEIPDISEYVESGLLVHPCNKSIIATFSYIPNSVRCDTLVTRRWVFIDTCQQKTQFDQTAKILPLQDPDVPKNGQTNVDLWYKLNWPIYPNSRKYTVYIWALGTKRGNGITTYRNYYQPSSRSAWYPSNTKMFWQVEYILDDGYTVNGVSTVPSPIWGFTTRPICDLKVISVSAPPEVFTGRTMRVSWKVSNVGNGQNFKSVYWRDKVFLTKHIDRAFGFLTQMTRENRILFPGDGYTSTATLNIPKDLLGDYYVVVMADYYKNLIDADYTNNKKASLHFVKIRLTPPPDLTVTKVLVPSTVFSGSNIEIRWTTKNIGNGATTSTSWADRVYFNSSSSNKATRLSTWYNSKKLFPGSEYTVVKNITLPKYIKGKYNMYVYTNEYHQEFEYDSYDNNIKGSVPFDVFLTPPPDLKLSTIQAVENAESGDYMKIEFTVTNVGQGETDLSWWNDKLIIFEKESGNIVHRSSIGHVGHLTRKQSYDARFDFTIPLYLKSSIYTISVTTNSDKSLFEDGNFDNNVLKRDFKIKQILADLNVEEVRFISEGNRLTGQIRIKIFNSVVKNIGKLPVSDVFWRDVFEVRCSSGYNKVFLEKRLEKHIQPGQKYNVTGEGFIVRQRDTKCRIELIVDIDSNIIESNKQNNKYISKEFSPTVFYDDVVFNVKPFVDDNSTVADTLLAGNSYTMEVAYTNKKVYPTLAGFNEKLELKLKDRVYDLGTIFVKQLGGNSQYTLTAKFEIPKNVFGSATFFLMHDIGNTLISKSPSVVYKKEIYIYYPPSPDLAAVELSFVENKDLINVFWKVKNNGNSMQQIASWTDALILSSSKTKPLEEGYRIVLKSSITAKMQSGQTYEKSKQVQRPDDMFGEFYIHLMVDYLNEVQELDGENNNHLTSNGTIHLKKPDLPDLYVTIVALTASPQIHGGDMATISFEIGNNGNKLSNTAVLYEIQLVPEVFQITTTLVSKVIYSSFDEIFKFKVAENIRFPIASLPGNYKILVTIDKNKNVPDKNRDNNFDESSSISLKQIPVSEVQITPSDNNITVVSGQPIIISYTLRNLGPGNMSVLTPSYISVVLSDDQVLDPFDIKVCGQYVTVEVLVNGTYSATIDCKIPFDLPSSKYYLILTCSGQTISKVTPSNDPFRDTIIMNNIVQRLRTDLAVVGVKSSKMVNVEGSIESSWEIKNNGSKDIEMIYKCDTLYLSEDRNWDIDDAEIKQQCGLVKKQGHGVSKKTMINEKIPLIKQSSFYSIVKTRSSAQELNLNNNIGVSNETTLILHQNLTLGTKSTFQIKHNGIVLRIPDVPPGESLSVQAESNDKSNYIDLFVNSGDIATSENYIAYSGKELLSKQTVIVSNTKSNDYYVYVRSINPLKAFDVNVFAKVAVFEITSVYPSSCPPIDDETVTFQIKGSLFPSTYSVKIGSKIIPSEKVYRFSPSVIYATVDLSGFVQGEKLAVEITDLNTGSKALAKNIISVESGDVGVLKTSVTHPRGVRINEDVSVTITFKNMGKTDILPAIIYMNIKGNVTVKNMNEQKTINGGKFLFLATSLDKPAGIMPPRHINVIDFVVVPEIRELASFPLSIHRFDNQFNQPHPYLDLKNELRPLYMSDRRWNPVWNLFLQNVGKTMREFHHRITKTASQFSMIKTPTILIDELVSYELNLANGFYLSNNLHSSIDLETSDDTFIPIQIKRYMNPKLSFRDIPGNYNGYGPFGRGWISPYWAINIIKADTKNIVLDFVLNIYEFEYNEEKKAYISKNGIGRFTQADDSYIFEKTDQSPSFLYTFNKHSLSLVKISTKYSETVVNFDENKSKIWDNLGNSFLIDYGSNSFIQQIKHFKNDVLHNVASYTYREDYTLQRAAIGSKQDTIYEYKSDFSLAKVTYYDKTSVEYLYNSVGHYTGYRQYDSEMKFLHSTQYQLRGVGHFIVSESPGEKITEVKFDRFGRPVWFQGKGGLPTIVVNKESERQIYQDDMLIMTEVQDATTGKITNAEDNTVTTEFTNDGSSISKITDPNGYVYENTFDDYKNLNHTIFPDGLSEAYSYDEKGNLKTIVARSKQKTSFSFDDEGNLLLKSNPSKATRYEYFPDGLLKKASTKDSVIDITYDSEKRPNSVTYDGKTALFYKYNRQGQRTSLADSTGQYNITYHYNSDGKLVQAKQNGKKELLFLQYQNGDLKMRRTGDDTRALLFYNNQTKKLESMQLLSQEQKEDFKYTHDRFGRIKFIKQSNNEGIMNWNFAYDRLSQLLSYDNHIVGISNEITYDKNYNRKMLKTKKENYFYNSNSMNQMTSLNEEIKMTNDDNGNMVRIENIKEHSDNKYSYDSENRLTGTSSLSDQCSYAYDALGNVKEVNCNGIKTTYLIDPFGQFGADVVGKFSGSNATYYYHAMEQGMVCRQDKHNINEIVYYQYDHIGSVIRMTNEQGKTINRYYYDPFGNIVKKAEKQINEFLFAGQWGVRALPRAVGVYIMRSRIYMAKYGRFASLDPLGFGGKSSNMYCYVGNNPVQAVDPKGTFPIPLAGALINVGFYLIDAGIKSANGESDPPVEFWAGLAGTAVAGAIPIPGLADAAGNLVKQSTEMIFSDHKFDVNDLIKDTTTGLVMDKVGGGFGKIAKKVFRKNPTLQKLAGKFASLTKGVRGTIWRKMSKGFLSKFKKPLRKFGAWAAKKTLAYIGGHIKSFIGSEIYDAILSWVLSIDPNDMIGPNGYGDGQFVSRDLLLKYKIRFENNENATAPAQKVLITATLDDDLDLTTFEFCSFGFGNFTFMENTCTPILQKKLDVQKSLSVYVRVFAAIDLKSRKMTFSLESLDPSTGDIPSNPLIGFLPPNPSNGTSGQGFITYSVNSKDTTPTYSVIDAKGSIVFDQNEPIDTPPIFNTIDGDQPSVNISLKNSQSNSSSFIFDVSTEDKGSGIAGYNVFTVDGSGRKTNYLTNMRTKTFGVDFKRGSNHILSIDVMDNVGNLLIDGARYNVNIPPASCLNNCSGNGQCIEQNICSCDAGRYGEDCSSNKKPLEPPILFIDTVKISNFSSKLPVNVFVNVLDTSQQVTVLAKIEDIPDDVEIKPGVRQGNKLILFQEELKELEMSFDQARSDFNLKMTVEATETGGYQTFRSYKFLVTTSGSLKPKLKLPSVHCYDSQKTHFKLAYTIHMPFNASELVSLTISNVPSNVNITNAEKIDNNTYFIRKAISFDGLDIVSQNVKDALDLTLTASAKPKYGESLTHISIKKCDVDTNTDADKSSKKNLIIGVVVGVLVLLVIIAIVVYIRTKRSTICLWFFRGRNNSMYMYEAAN